MSARGPYVIVADAQGRWLPEIGDQRVLGDER